MLTASLIVALLAGGTVHEDAAEAVRLARAGAHAEALDRFRRVVESNRSDIEARVWMARVLMWTGQRAEAESVLRTVLSDAPADVDAMMTLGSLLATAGRVDEAVVLLQQAETLHPDRADTLAALGRAHRLAGRTTLALSYGRRAAAAAPNDADIRDALETTTYQHGHRARTLLAFEHFSSSAPGSRSGLVDVNLRMTDRVRLGLHQQVQRKFNRTESRLGAEIEWRYDRATLVRGEVFGSAGAQVLPRADVGFEVERSTSRADVLGTVRFARFQTASVWVAAPGVVLPIRETLSISARYYVSFTRFDAASSGILPSRSALTVVNHSAGLGLRARLARRAWIDGGYARGNETFETLSVDRIGRFRADTFSTGIRLDNASRTSFTVSAEYQASGDRDLFRLTAGVTQRF
jgi:YaiO family outer membrane protein